ncbi:MAG: hypothetical protein JWR61_1035 [Ferruginibacter sp.]|uniref:hypothetical protein n=1 Tax=Ferruginibacter sp. TaxID=1940288 RepID=UPI002659EC10|nr:hypothetical protein [Ferruginibacter sp.]MDB5276080.1 hypothetical protein [Ferruginibacter sp.]
MRPVLSYKWKKILYWFELIALLLMVSDAFLFQVHDTGDSIDFFSSIETDRRINSHYSIYYLNTKAGLQIPLPEDGNYNIPDTCKLTINKGFFTKKPASVDIIEGTYHHHYLTSILNRTFGSLMITVTLALFILFVTLQWVLKKTLNEMLLFIILFFELFFIIEIWV